MSLKSPIEPASRLSTTTFASTITENEEDLVSPRQPRERRLASLLDKETMEKLYLAVNVRDKDGDGCVTPELFCSVLRGRKLAEEKVAQRLFEKIDWSSMHRVSWNEFCTFLEMEFKMKEGQEVDEETLEFCLPPLLSGLPTRDPSIKVLDTQDGLWITISMEATIALWDNHAVLKRHRLCLSKRRLRKKLHKTWITDAMLMPEYSKVILTTGDREIQFYDMATFSPFCQISGLESIPITMCYRPIAVDKCVLVYGDQMGCVSVISFHCMAKSFRLWKKLHKHEEFIPSIPIEQAIAEDHVSFMRWQVHREWILQVRFYTETDQILSCSKDPHASLVLGNRRGSTQVLKLMKDSETRGRRGGLYACTRCRLPQDQVVYSLTTGISVFDFAPSIKMVATGGRDRMVRLWNCFISKEPVGRLWGHYTNIRCLQLCPYTYRLFSASADRWVKVWDVLEQTCLQTVPWHVHRVKGDLQSLRYNRHTHSLALLGENIAILKVKMEDECAVVNTHHAPVTCIVYNPLFQHLISASSDSMVRTWDLTTGTVDGEFHAHGHAAITHMVLDSAGKRLLTVATDGTGKMWNYNTGQCVRGLQPVDQELCTITYADMHNIKYVLTGGWSHHVNKYIDDTPETIPFELPRLNTLRDDLVRGHQEDILCSDFSGRDKVATGGYDGQVMVWNMEAGYKGYMLLPPSPSGWSRHMLEDDQGVSCVHFLRQRSRARRGASLVVGGPHGHLSMWDANFARPPPGPLAHFPVSSDNTETNVVSVSAMDSDPSNVVMVTGDSSGYVTVWGIEGYAMVKEETEPPPVVSRWLAHLQKVTGVKMAQGDSLVVTSSTDHTVRLWTQHGHFVGTFGQRVPWHVEDETTYRHPDLPSDVDELLRPPDQVVKKKVEDTDDLEHEVEVRPRRGRDHFGLGINYFARKKAVVSKKGRHLNDEVLQPFSCTGMTTPFHSLRQHDLVSCPALPDKPLVADQL